MSEHKAYSELVVDLDNLAFNIKSIKKEIKKDFIMVVKNDAYGHGAVRVSQCAFQNGVDTFAVISLREAVALRMNSSKFNIIIMGKVPLEDFSDVVELDFQPTVFDIEELKRLDSVCKRLGKGLKVHINIETGMNRLGVNCEEAKELLKYIENSSFLKVGGVYSHFSTPNDSDFSKFQLQIFEKCVESFNKKYYLHFANSVPSLNYPSTRYDGVRIGILSYGINQSDFKDIRLKKVSTLKSKIIKIIKVKKGESVGYGRKFIAKKDSKIALLQIGYGDGIPYNFNEGGEVFINSKRYRVVGSVCMDHIFVKVDERVKIFDYAEIFGNNIPIEEMASKLHTIPYDILVKINSNVLRRYVKNGKTIAKTYGDCDA